ncbi:MAG: DUF4833 domain-containing protein [Cyclobacteriaceae bacterium]|nr:DUF4833 domain-containing protein [Cyclobacteriaceae bacterium]
MKALILSFCIGLLTIPAFHRVGYYSTMEHKIDLDTFPTPNGIRNMLFYVQRTPNTNTVIYELNVDENNLIDMHNPVNIYWIRYAEKRQKADLSFIQRTYAYGLKIKEIENNNFELRFVSYKKKPFYLIHSKHNQRYHVYATVKNKPVILSRIFLQIEGGTFWFPNVVYVEFKGVDPSTGEIVSERFKP